MEISRIRAHASSVRIGRLRRSLGSFSSPSSDFDCFKHLSEHSLPKQLDSLELPTPPLSFSHKDEALLEQVKVMQATVKDIALKVQQKEASLSQEIKHNEDLRMMLLKLERASQPMQTVDTSCRCSLCTLF